MLSKQPKNFHKGKYFIFATGKEQLIYMWSELATHASGIKSVTLSFKVLG